MKPALERPSFGGLTRTPSRRKMPLGLPSAQRQRSPLTPTIVAFDARRFCIDETVSRPTTASFESTVRRRYAPTGLGPRTIRIETGPCGVNWTPCSYVTPGKSVVGAVVCACPGGARTAAASAASTDDASRRSTAGPRLPDPERAICRLLHDPYIAARAAPAPAGTKLAGAATT